MKLMDIDQDTLGIPDTEYDSKVYMPSQEFARICRELASLGESVRIEVTKEGIRFASEGDIANGSVLLKPTEGAGRYAKKSGMSNGVKKEPTVKKEKTDDDEEMEEDDAGAVEEAAQEEQGEDGDEEQPAPKKKKKQVVVDDDEEDAVPEDEPEDEEEPSSKKRKRKPIDGASSSKKAKRGKKSAGSDGEEDEDANSVSISVTQAVSLSFSLKYLINFAKAAGLTSHVELMMSTDVPLLVSQIPSPTRLQPPS
jgi:proliferating cell nuclear antigen